MRHYCCTSILLFIGIIGVLSAAADRPNTLLPPRWHVSLDPLRGTHPEGTRITSVGDVILVSHYPAVIAVDRTNGHELWRSSEPDADSVKLSRTTTGWQLLSSGLVDNVGPVALLLEIRGITTADSNFPSGERSVAEYSEVALNAVSGQVLWRCRSDVYCTSTLVANLVVNVVNAEAQNQPKTLRYQDAATGAVLNEANAQVRAAIQRAVRTLGSGTGVSSSFSAVYKLDIESGTALGPFHAANYMVSYAFFPEIGRIVFYNNSANEGLVGHSTWPKYVASADMRSANEWTFPPKVEFVGIGEKRTIPEPYSIGAMTPCRACGTLLCVNDKVEQNGKFSWYGLDARDGKILWKNVIVDEPPVTAECGAGFLVIAYRDTARGKVNLEWMDGRIGKLVRIGPAPDAAMMEVADSDLLVLDPNGSLSAYSLDKMLPATARNGIRR